MFMLSKIADLIQLHPEKFNLPSEVAITEAVNTKYANKVILELGLCICMWDMSFASEGLISPLTGMCNVNVEFRMTVFRPFVGEVIRARIVNQTREGIHLSLGFFDDIFVPASELMDGAQYVLEKDHKGNVSGTWVVDLEDDQKLYYDNSEGVYFSVLSEEWHDQTPKGPVEAEAANQLLPSYKIIGTMKAPGLGCCLWWQE